MRQTFANPHYRGVAGTFDAYEVSLVQEFAEENRTSITVEPVNDLSELSDEATSRFFTLYGHIPGLGVRALVDRDHIADIAEVMFQMGILGYDEAEIMVDEWREKLEPHGLEGMCFLPEMPEEEEDRSPGSAWDMNRPERELDAKREQPTNT